MLAYGRIRVCVYLQLPQKQPITQHTAAPNRSAKRTILALELQLES